MIAVQNAVPTRLVRFKLDAHEVAVTNVAEGVPRGRLGVCPFFSTEGRTGSLEELDWEKIIASGDVRAMNAEVKRA